MDVQSAKTQMESWGTVSEMSLLPAWDSGRAWYAGQPLSKSGLIIF